MGSGTLEIREPDITEGLENTIVDTQDHPLVEYQGFDRDVLLGSVYWRWTCASSGLTVPYFLGLGVLVVFFFAMTFGDNDEDRIAGIVFTILTSLLILFSAAMQPYRIDFYPGRMVRRNGPWGLGTWWTYSMVHFTGAIEQETTNMLRLVTFSSNRKEDVIFDTEDTELLRQLFKQSWEAVSTNGNLDYNDSSSVTL